MPAGITQLRSHPPPPPSSAPAAMRHPRPTREAAAQHHARSRHRPTRSRAGRGDARPYEAPRAAPPVLPYRSPRRSPQLPATAARNRSMWVFRLLSGSHITCDSMISGSRDMAAENGGARRTVTAPAEPPHSRVPTAALSAHCAAQRGALPFNGRLTARRGNLPRSQRSAPRPVRACPSAAPPAVRGHGAAARLLLVW